MVKQGLKDLLGQTIEHKKLGLCEVVEIVQENDGKFVGKVVETGDLKKFVFSKQFFNNLENYITVQVAVPKKATPQRVHKRVDLDKYRNHPLVKEIDQKEGGYRPRQLYDEVKVTETETDNDTELES